MATRGARGGRVPGAREELGIKSEPCINECGVNNVLI